MQNPSRFVVFDPSQRIGKKKAIKKSQCQTCFNSFETQQELRNHIADYQLEFQLLSARLIEVQAHLPREHQTRGVENLQAAIHKPDSIFSDQDTDDERDESSSLSNTRDHDDDRDDVSSSNQDDEDLNFSSTNCPYPRCRHNGRFLKRWDLERHFESHVQCHEICIYCRQLFQQTRSYRRHRCLMEQKANDEARDFYRKERCAQLKRISAEKLSRMLASEKHHSRRLNKRGTEYWDAETNSPRKLQKGNISLVGESTLDNEGADGHLGARAAAQAPFIMPHTLNPPSYPSTALSNTTLSSHNPSVEHMQQPYNSLGPQPYAPIFDEITITPCYDLVQESYAFSSTVQNATYLTEPLEDQ